MDFKKTITLLAVMCAFSSFGQELIAPYNIYRNVSSTAGVFDTVPSDEIWKIEGFGAAHISDDAWVYLTGTLVRFIDKDKVIQKFPFWLDSGETIYIPGSTSNTLVMISILRFTKPD